MVYYRYLKHSMEPVPRAWGCLPEVCCLSQSFFAKGMILLLSYNTLLMVSVKHVLSPIIFSSSSICKRLTLSRGKIDFLFLCPCSLKSIKVDCLNMIFLRIQLVSYLLTLRRLWLDLWLMKLITYVPDRVTLLWIALLRHNFSSQNSIFWFIRNCCQ